MGNFYTDTQIADMNNVSPKLKTDGINWGSEMDDIREQLSTGNLGIQSLARDVDNLAVAERNISYDSDNTTGLTFGYRGGQINVEGTGGFTAVAAGTISLSASNTNYVEVDASGTVSKNTSGFTDGKIPLFIVVTGVSTITSVAPAKNLLRCRPSAGLPGKVMSAAMQTESYCVRIDSTVNSGAVPIPTPNYTATVVNVQLIPDSAVSASDSTYYTATLTDKGTDGTGTGNALLDNGAGNTTKATGGAALVANAPRTLTLTATSANLTLTANRTLLFAMTKTSTPADFKGTVKIEFTRQA